MSDSMEEYLSPLNGEVLETDADYIAIVYQNSGIRDALGAYLEPNSGVDNAAVEALLERFAATVADTAWKNGVGNADLVRFSFNQLRADMDEAASAAYGYEKPKTTFQALLNRMGLARVPKRYIAPLEDKYWSEQFPEQFKNGGLPFFPRQEGETDEEYWPRYVYGTMHGFVFTPYTYLV